MGAQPEPVALPDGATRLYLIVGDPIAQVRSPAGMTAAFAARGHNAILVPAQVAPADFAGFVRAARAMRNLDGLVVTIPHKFAAADVCAELSARARLLSSVNVMRRRGEAWYGDMLDGAGFVAAVAATGYRLAGRRALLVGAGGAGSAVALALIEAGVAALAIADADVGRRDALIGRLRPNAAARLEVGSADPTGFDFIANATPAGMQPDDPMPIDVARLPAGAFCACVITKPLPPPWLAAARAVGCRTCDGLDMYRAVQSMMVEFFTRAADAADPSFTSD